LGSEDGYSFPVPWKTHDESIAVLFDLLAEVSLRGRTVFEGKKKPAAQMTLCGNDN
jgi:hypothetical protein